MDDADSWEFVVEEILSLSQRPHPTAAGIIRTGTIHIGDSFHVQGAVNDNAVGHVMGIAFVDHPGTGSAALIVEGLEPSPGDILVGSTPKVPEKQ
jgi:hypothetical protein